VTQLRTGPTSINVLGSYYPHQQEKQKIADMKMVQRARNVTEVLAAPSLKEKAYEAIASCEHSIEDTRINNQDMKRLA